MPLSEGSQHDVCRPSYDVHKSSLSPGAAVYLDDMVFGFSENTFAMHYAPQTAWRACCQAQAGTCRTCTDLLPCPGAAAGQQLNARPQCQPQQQQPQPEWPQQSPLQPLPAPEYIPCVAAVCRHGLLPGPSPAAAPAAGTPAAWETSSCLGASGPVLDHGGAQLLIWRAGVPSVQAICSRYNRSTWSDRSSDLPMLHAWLSRSGNRQSLP